MGTAPARLQVKEQVQKKTVEPQQNSQTYTIDFGRTIPHVTFHIAAIVGIFFVPITLNGILLFIGMYYLGMFGVAAGYHRYFSHRSFKTSRWFQFILALLGSMTAQNGVLWWAAYHRHHHRHSDQVEDLHSPARYGFFWSHTGWFLTKETNDTKFDLIRDFSRFPELVWLNRYFSLPFIASGIVLALFGGWTAFYWGFVLKTVVLWHGTYTVNSVSHLWGSRRYKTSDTSRNNAWLVLLTMGECWHNNHHQYMSSARQGFFWWEIDTAYYFLRVLQKLGIVFDIHEPPERLFVC